VVTVAGAPRRRLTATQRTCLYLLFAVVVGGLSWSVTFDDQWSEARALFWVELVLGLVSLAAVPFRRRWPLAAAVLTNVATALSSLGVGAWLVCQASLATRRRWRELLPTGALAVVTGQLYLAAEPGQTMTWYSNLLWCVLSSAAITAAGMYVGARRDLVASLRDRAERAERAQKLELATARTGERTRIAREMHDVLAHRMSLVALHAGALAYREDLGPDETRAAAAVIQSNAQRALADLREILGLLRDTEQRIDATGHRPQPTLGDLDTLLDDERAAGTAITLRADLAELGALPETVGRSAYRIVQEGLTNARKHAPHAAVTVEVAGRPGAGLDLCVRNPLAVGGNGHRTDPHDAGFGLVGVAERAAASHGRVEHGRTPDGDFVLRAWLPWER
jgi:signal transduction histidine kinase